MGRIVGAFGVRGWVRLQPFTQTPESLVAYPEWWIGGESGWQPLRIEEAQAQANSVVAKIAGCDDRDAAALYRGKEVAVSRGAFPEAGENEYYWADLIGLEVVNDQGENLGTVAEIFDTGSNDVLVVTGERERLIPFLAHVVMQVDVAGRVIRVDWGADY